MLRNLIGRLCARGIRVKVLRIWPGTQGSVCVEKPGDMANTLIRLRGSGCRTEVWSLGYSFTSHFVPCK